MSISNNRLCLLASLATLSACYAGGQLRAQEINTPEIPKAVHKTMLNADALRGLNGASTAGNGIFYHGGPIMLGTPNVYLIWYGTWTASSQAILTNLITNLGGSPYLRTNTTYYDGSNNFVTANTALGGQTTDNYSQGKSLSDTQIQTIVANAIKPTGVLPLDPNGVYFVLTATDVTAASGFCTVYCGWHTSGTIQGLDIKFAFVGNPAVKCPQSCAAQTTSPNSDFGADAVASIVSHELEETFTDPDGNAWYDNVGNENADKCAWTFGTTYKTANGAMANVNLGGKDYLIQQNWVNAGGGFCAMSYNTSTPTLTTVAPSSGKQGAAVNVTLTGTNFAAGATVGVSGSGVTASNVTVVSATQITATLTIAASAATGPRNVSVTTSAGTTNTVPFTVNGLLTLTGLTPNSGTQGSAVNVTLTGTNFAAGATVGVSGSGVTASNVTVVSATQITATLTIAASAAAGPHNVSVTTAASASNAVPFTVNGLLTLTSIAPNNGTQGTATNVTLTGTNFAAGAIVGVGGSGVTASNVTVVSATQITATLTTAASAAAGPYNVSVTTAAGTSNTMPFTVKGMPALTGVTPNSGTQGTAVNVTLSGTNFIAGATIGVGGTGVAASNVSVVSATQITATLTIAASAAAGPHNISVMTSAGASNTVPFTVNATPGLSSITPNSGTQGTSVNVLLTGTNFIAGAAVVVSGSGVTAGNVTVVSATQIRATITSTASVATGAYSVSVTTIGGTSNTVPFTVTGTSGAPTLSSMTPPSGTRGSTVNVTLTGTNFTPQTTVRLPGAGAAYSNVVVVNSTQITVTFTLSSTTATGAHNVYVVTSAGNSNFLPFTVD